MAAIWAWDEISGEWLEAGRDWPDYDAAFGAADADEDSGWDRQPDDGPFRVFLSSRGHLALVVYADSAQHVHEMAMDAIQPYKETQG